MRVQFIGGKMDGLWRDLPEPLPPVFLVPRPGNVMVGISEPHAGGISAGAMANAVKYQLVRPADRRPYYRLVL